MKRIILLPLLILLVLALPACSPAQSNTPQQSSDEALNVSVSIVPQKYFVERVGGEHVNVSVMVEPGASPATYEPNTEQMKALSEAAAYVSIGVPFENAWIDKIQSANENMLMVDSTNGIERVEGESGFDPHIWVSPSLVKIQSQTICDALVQLDPANQADYQANLDAFLADIDELDSGLKKTLEGVKSRKFIVFHPAWGYFARDYDLEMIPIEVGGQEPSAQELADLVDRAKNEDIKVIFAQPEFSTRSAETIATEIDGKVLLISPLADDWMSNLQEVADTFADVLGK